MGNDSVSVEERRTAFASISKITLMPRKSAEQSVEVMRVPSEWRYVEGVRQDRVILYIHGSAFIFGSPWTHRGIAARLSRESNARVLLPDHRLAPEHPFPAALEDVKTAYLWLLQNGFSPKEIIIAGDSSGGGLAVSTTSALLDQGDPPPAALLCISPWADLELTGESIKTKAQAEPFLREEALRFCAAQYLNGAAPDSPLCSPIHADFSGFPPMLIHVSSEEILLDDARRLAVCAQDHGVEVTLHVQEGMWHAWHFFGGLVKEADLAIRALGQFAQSKFGKGEHDVR
jgi:acetyl esterase/lipase